MIPIFEPSFANTERENLIECIDSGWISSQGHFIPDFEDAFAARIGMPCGVATSSCTTALHLALTALGVGDGDEVLCPDLTFIAPANMIHLTGAKPVLVDVEPTSWAIDPARMAERITPRTRAVAVVHPFGHAADMDPILSLSAKHGIAVVEDVAEAPGARYRGRALGTFGELSCYSFFANKIMTTGEGGMVLCRDPELDIELRVRRDHGMSLSRRYVHDVVGFNYRMTNMQAAIGLAQLGRLDAILKTRDAQAERYRRRFDDCARIAWRPREDYCDSVHWLATVTLETEDLRDPLLEHLNNLGIDARQMVFPVHMATPYRDGNAAADFPVSRSVSLRSLHLPSSTGLAGDDVERIADVAIEWVEAHG